MQSLPMPEREGDAGVVVLINTGKVEALDRLTRQVPASSVHVITEAAYSGLYPPSVPLHLVDDVGDADAVLQVVLALAAGHGVRAVVTPSERSMPAGGFVRSVLSLPGVPFETANLLTNKVAMKQRLFCAGVPVAPFRGAVGAVQLRAAARDLGFPVIVKPAFGTGSMNTHVLKSEAELDALLESDSSGALVEPPRYLAVESFLPIRQELTCDGIVVAGEVSFAIASRYHAPLIGGIGTMVGASTISPGDPLSREVRALHERVVNVLGVRDAVTHMEALVTDDGMLLGEIACRPGGAGVVDSARLATGVDLWEAFMLLSLGRPVPCTADGSHPAPLLWTSLPTEPGRVIAVSTMEDFEDVKGVRLVDMHIRVGDTISSRMHSASTTGIVFLDVPDTSSATINDRLRRVRTAYRLQVSQTATQETAEVLA
jgi:hypothetical protein